MSNDSFTEVSRESWFSRIKGAFKGILFGIILFIVAFPILFSNEGRSVKRYKTLKEGGGSVISIAADQIDLANSGKLVHVTGKAETEATLTDQVFGVSAKALKLERTVEMYQWEESVQSETKKKVGGSTETVKTYSYDKTWSDKPVSSANFKKQADHQNPATIPYNSVEQVADPVTLGAFTLSPSLVGRINNFTPLSLNSNVSIPRGLRGRARIINNEFYIGQDPADPKVGDIRVYFNVAEPTEISIIAKQVNSTFNAYKTKAGGTIELLQLGTHDADSMVQKAQNDNKVLTWIIRILGFILMMAGLNLIFKPLSVLADVLPILGNIVGAGTGFIAFLLAGLFSTITIAIAWIFYRPLLGIILLVVAVGIVILVRNKLKKVKTV